MTGCGSTCLLPCQGKAERRRRHREFQTSLDSIAGSKPQPPEGAQKQMSRGNRLVKLLREPSQLLNSRPTWLLCFICSSLVRTPEDRVMLFCKGADTIIYELLHPSCASLGDVTMDHLDVSVKVANDGSCGWFSTSGHVTGSIPNVGCVLTSVFFGWPKTRTILFCCSLTDHVSKFCVKELCGTRP